MTAFDWTQVLNAVVPVLREWMQSPMHDPLSTVPAILREAVAAHPDDPGLWETYAHFLEQCGKHPEAAALRWIVERGIRIRGLDSRFSVHITRGDLTLFSGIPTTTGSAPHLQPSLIDGLAGVRAPTVETFLRRFASRLYAAGHIQPRDYPQNWPDVIAQQHLPYG